MSPQGLGTTGRRSLRVLLVQACVCKFLPHETFAATRIDHFPRASVDVTSRVDNDLMARTAIEQYDGLHVVVTAAGVASGGYVSGDLELAEKSMRVISMFGTSHKMAMPVKSLPASNGSLA